MHYVIAIVVVVVLIPIVIFNSLIGKKNQVLNVFATIDVLLKKRYDLVPNLVSTVKGYAKHERELFQQITDIRAKAMSGTTTPDEATMLDSDLTKALSRLMLVVENYPDLKAGENFMHLQRTLTEVEEQISAARRAYNASVVDYNNAVEMFPTNIIASMMNYQRRKFFEIPKAERENVDVTNHLEDQE